MERFVQTNGIQLHCLDHPGGEPPLVLMPGLTANAHIFDGLLEAGLSPALRVLALDLRGRGLSDKPERGYGMAEHAADVVGLLEALGLERVVLGGHSFGGLLALYMAAHYPERVARLVVLDAAGSFHSQARALIQPSLDRLGTVHPSWEAYLASIKRLPFYAGWWDPTIESAYRADVETRADGTLRPRSRPEAIGEALDRLLAEDWPGHLAAVRQPMLLVNAPGAYGPPGTPPVLPREQALETVAAVADGHYVEVPGNHMTMLFGEGAARTVKAILDFVRP